MSDIQWFLELLQKIFGNEIVGWVVFILTPPAVLFALMWLVKGIIEITRTTFIPLLYNAEQKRKIRTRQRFADHIESEIRRLNQREDWSDFRFAELEAEVEMDGTRKAFSLIPFIKRSSRGLRREKTLSKALQRSREKLILLEGDPGSGKSVALRHVALDLARRAIRSKNSKSLIPFYINLKELQREENQRISRSTIESFIIKTLKRINDRDVDKFLDDEFQAGLENGSWFFLFDSFDEIPEILGAEDASSKIKEYAEAIADFLHGLNACRGVIASRYFKGPNQLGWARFKILSLSGTRQKELIKRSELKPLSEKLLLGNLETASPEIRGFATNPLFLGLLIGYIQTNETFPQHSNVVFDAFINRRLTQDKERILQRFGLSIEEIRQIAEEVAFCMSASSALGLSPTREAIKKSFEKQNISINDNFNSCLDALEFTKLGRSGSLEALGDERIFAFSHRRFQEYFATTLVLARANITIEELLINPRWRETTVVICQTQPIDIVFPIIEGSAVLVNRYWNNLHPKLQTITESGGREIPIEFPWPKGCLHLLDLLQNGFSNRLDLLPDGLRNIAGAVVSLATLLGSLSHRIWALEVAGILPSTKLLEVIRPAIVDQSHFLSDVAYRQVARLDEIPNDIRAWIRKAILKKMLQLGIFKGSNVLYAQVSRMANAKDNLAVIRGIQLAYLIDLISAVVIAGILFYSALIVPLANRPLVGIITLGAIMIIFSLSILFASITITENELYFMNRLLVGGASYPLVFFTLSALNIDYFAFLVFLYLSTIMPILLLIIKDFPFEKGILVVLFTPFIAFQIASRKFRGLLNSLKGISLSKRGKRIMLVGFGFLTSYCALVFSAEAILGFEDASMIIGAISTLIILMVFYKVISRTFLEDRKYAKAWKNWLSESHKDVSVDEIITILPLLSTLYAYRFIALVRENNLLQPSRDSLYFVSQLIRMVENPFIETEFSKPLRPFLQNIKENKYRSMLLDELFQSMSQIKSKVR